MTPPKMNWAKAKRELQKLEKPELIDLLKRLFNLDAGTKAVFEASFSPLNEVPEYYKQEVKESLYPDVHYDNSIDLRRARKAISAYKKACPNDLWGQTDLMLDFVEHGSYFILDYGDIDSRLCDSLMSMIDAIVKLSSKLSPTEYGLLVERFKHLNKYTSQIGWGYSNYVAEVTCELQECPRVKKS